MRRLLLAGAGHAHAQVLRDWARAPLPGVELVLVSPHALAPYSGMVPGWLAGQYSFDSICIDFRALAAAAGAHFMADALVGLDPVRQRAQLASGAQLDYALLSLNVGSTLQPPAGLPARVLALRPLGELHTAWNTLLPTIAAERADRPCRVLAVGGGAAGVESLLAVLASLRARQPGRDFSARLMTQSQTLLPGLAAGAVRAAQSALASAGVQLLTGTACTESAARDCELLLWATGALAQPWQAASGLALDAGGFVQVDARLRSLSHPTVFAVGDCAAFSPRLPKAGVHAVRMGPVLQHNLRAALTGQPLRAHHPEQRMLVLLSTADGRAIAARGGWSLSGPVLGRWAWRWKDWIDRRFVGGFVTQAAAG
jgi:pyridine nucleotide-disulfide oxidoreductase family protein